ncbi:hypothetical protein CYFUS_001548 [Cystobacter fuscus]|uniref:Pyrroline-5-carboxylate reductase catalytic N-terminal domain-containing protein n=1 Tax=Cystobacter fuscus TaxID=43 RepID=A0A250IWM9_9BACT|nr:NAD(P)-binding domain-containing protein [Cystobacter fuscus]ATB36134.1 hypothetical protein CYFUS_001548 [Cystobacter fuscus]
MAATKIAIIGNGNVGSALEKGAKNAGYEVRTTGADPKDVRTASAWGDFIILTIPASARQDAIKNLGATRYGADIGFKVVWLGKEVRP